MRSPHKWAKEIHAIADGKQTQWARDYNKPIEWNDFDPVWDSSPISSSDEIITNPPFNLSEQFIRHAIGQAGVVAMLLKSQYWHAQKRIDLFKEYPPAYVLPLTWRPDFLFDQRANGVKGSPTMEVHWTVWVQGDYDTRYRLLKKPAI